MRHSIFISLALLGLFATCTSPNPSFCDQSRQCLPDDFCDLDAVIDGTELTNSCVAKPSPNACNLATSCSDDEHCTDDSFGICVECLETTHCQGTDLCNVELGECVNFCEQTTEGDEYCAGLDDGVKPRCGEEGRCVGCIEPSDCAELSASVCEDFSCRGCNAHSECASRRCILETSTCLDEDTIVYVAIAGIDNGSCGPKLQPCRTIGYALSKVDATRSTVLVSQGIYTELLSLANITVSIVGEDVVQLGPGLNSEAAIEVGGNSIVTLENLLLKPASSASGNTGVECDATTGQSSLTTKFLTVETVGGIGIVGIGCNVNLQETTIQNNTGVGVEITDGILRLHRSVIRDNEGGGVNISSSDYDVVNNFITDNGSGEGNGSFVGGIAMTGTSGLSEVFRFNTLAGNSTGSGVLGGSALSCSATDLAASSNIIVLGGGGGGLGLMAGTCTSSYSLIEADAPVAGDGNIIGDPGFAAPGQADYHISTNSPCHDKAAPDATLYVDFDGHVRPQGAGPDMGADEVAE